MSTPNPRTLLTGTTPGPWEAEPWSDAAPDADVIAPHSDEDGTRKGWTHIATDASTANARLIAAAPDLAARVIALEDGIRALHSRETIQVITGDCAAEECDHENECPTVPIEVCAECYRIAEEADPYYGENGVRTVLYPCPTIALLDGEARA